MSDHCPQDGGFIGDAGCTHPNHQHSELVRKVLSSASNPREMSAADAESALREGFYVKNPEGKSVAFGGKLLTHLAAHNEDDANGRKARLQFAVAAVTHPDRTDKNHRGYEGRTLDAKKFEKFGMIAISELNKDTIDEIFTIVPKRNGGTK